MTIKALILQENPQERIVIKETDLPDLKPGEALIRIKAAALNHRDQWARVGMYPGLTYPSILGSDGCGVVEKVFDSEHDHWLGKEVIINPNVNWGDHPDYPSRNYTILGMPTHGTLAEYLIVPAHRLHLKPAHLSTEEAAAIPLAGLTAYRAVFTKGKVAADQDVFISGIGGGVALFALQFAVALGARVCVSSGQEEKLELARKYGAVGRVNYKEELWFKALQKNYPLGFQVIIDSAGGKDFGELAKMIALGGTMVVYGTTAGTPSPLNLPRLFFSQASIQGTTMGNDQEFEAMINFVNKHQIKPVVSSVRPLSEAISAFDEMAASKQFGKLVIKISET
ncbi:MAG: zinc-binding dehydrogenase [Microscillaceae bacterium]|nr:zinc-binding dehydrogenase [Microscillaceae bacterium]